MKQIVLILISLIFIRCNGVTIKGNRIDTLNIFHLVLTSKQIKNGFIPQNTDSIFIIKFKNFNKSWPNQEGQLKIFYIEDSENARVPNIPGPKFDKRIRLSVPIFEITNDSAKVVVHGFNFATDLIYSLKKGNNQWEILGTQLEMR